MLTVRPKVAELTFQLYGRPLHPELFAVVESCVLDCGTYTAKIDITGDGHAVTWRYAGLTLTETATSTQHPLPKMRRLLSYGLKGQRSDGVLCRGGVRYQVDFRLNAGDPKSFWAFQRRLDVEGRRRGLLHRFQPGNRIAPGALSAIDFEPRDRALLIRAFHTFPDDYAVVETRSLFRLP